MYRKVRRGAKLIGVRQQHAEGRSWLPSRSRRVERLCGNDEGTERLGEDCGVEPRFGAGPDPLPLWMAQVAPIDSLPYVNFVHQILKDPGLRLYNNVFERALCIQALGRNNFVFVGHDEAGQNLAILQTS